MTDRDPLARTTDLLLLLALAVGVVLAVLLWRCTPVEQDVTAPGPLGEPTTAAVTA